MSATTYANHIDTLKSEIKSLEKRLSSLPVPSVMRETIQAKVDAQLVLRFHVQIDLCEMSMIDAAALLDKLSKLWPDAQIIKAGRYEHDYWVAQRHIPEGSLWVCSHRPTPAYQVSKMVNGQLKSYTSDRNRVVSELRRRKNELASCLKSLEED